MERLISGSIACSSVTCHTSRVTRNTQHTVHLQQIAVHIRKQLLLRRQQQLDALPLLRRLQHRINTNTITLQLNKSRVTCHQTPTLTLKQAGQLSSMTGSRVASA